MPKRQLRQSKAIEKAIAIVIRIAFPRYDSFTPRGKARARAMLRRMLAVTSETK